MKPEIMEAHGKKSTGGRKLKHMTVTPSDNGGHTVESRFHEPPRKPNGPYIDYDSPQINEKSVFTTPEDMAQHVYSRGGGKKSMNFADATANGPKKAGKTNGTDGPGAKKLVKDTDGDDA